MRHFGIGRLHMQKEWYQWTEKCDIILLLRLMTPTALLAKEQKKKDKCVVWMGVTRRPSFFSGVFYFVFNRATDNQQQLVQQQHGGTGKR